MTVCAVVLSRNNADTVERVIRHLLWHVDEVAVSDHRSTDGAREIVEQLPVRLSKLDYPEFPGDAERTRLAHEAYRRGHEWAVAVDADEIWSPLDPDVRIADWLAACVRRDCLLAAAAVHDYVPTGDDDYSVIDPLNRIVWRHRGFDAMKYAGRLTPGLRYEGHGFRYPNVSAPRIEHGLIARHFSVRTSDQLVTKIRDQQDSHGIDAPGLTSWAGLSDGEIRYRFYDEYWFRVPNPDVLVRDPAPVRP